MKGRMNFLFKYLRKVPCNSMFKKSEIGSSGLLRYCLNIVNICYIKKWKFKIKLKNLSFSKKNENIFLWRAENIVLFFFVLRRKQILIMNVESHCNKYVNVSLLLK